MEFPALRVRHAEKAVGTGNYFNAGFFAQNADGSTVPVGNLVVDGNIITDAKTRQIG